MDTLNALKKLSVAVGATVISLGAIATAQAASIVVPNGLENIEGNSNNLAPFGFTQPQRSQQVYAASDFASLTGPEFVTQILFRSEAGFPPFVRVIPDIQINLSTTSAAPDTLSTVFANNIGPDDTTVFSGPLTFSSSSTGSAGGPNNFDIAIPLQNFFAYNPSAGNLLLDVRNNSGTDDTAIFDAQFTSGDSVSRVNSSDVNSPTADSGDTLGLVTRFETTPIPEPSSVLGGLITFAGLTSVRLFKQMRQKKSQKGEE